MVTLVGVGLRSWWIVKILKRKIKTLAKIQMAAWKKYIIFNDNISGNFVHIKSIQEAFLDTCETNKQTDLTSPVAFLFVMKITTSNYLYCTHLFLRNPDIAKILFSIYDLRYTNLLHFIGINLG